MDKIIESLSRLIPFERWGIRKEIGEPLSIIILVILTSLLGFIGNKIIRRIRTVKTALADMGPQFDYASIKKARKYYIQTQYQNASPARQEEPGFSHQYIARNKLIPFFIKIAFSQKAESERFYLILADSGMGKTTFMINLFLAYRSFFNNKRGKEIKIFRFSDPDTLSILKSIDVQEAKNTILLLDALDEDRGIISINPGTSDEDAFKSRVDKIVEVTKGFAEVIITCRTQYFPGQESDPYELNVRRPDEKGFYTFNKLYISPLTEKEVHTYLRKKYGWIPFVNRDRKRRAAAIVGQAKHLLMRPMLLSYIDYLIEGPGTYLNDYSIYDTLVKKWLKREAEKRKGIKDQDTFILHLERLSQCLAVSIYQTWKKDSRLYLSKEETMKIAKTFDITLEPQEITGQSLLTCDGAGNWKFAHKSIMEFFLAKAVMARPGLLPEVDFSGMALAKSFYYQLDEMPWGIKQLKNGSKSIYYTSLKNERLSVLQAMDFCNRVNEGYGYPKAYDLTTCSMRLPLAGIRGFRLPTPLEWRTLTEKRSGMVLSRVHFQGITYNRTKNSFNKVKYLEMHEHPIIHETELCYEDETAKACTIDEIIHLEARMDGHSARESTLHPKITSIENFNEPSYVFRLVFVP